MRISGNRVVVLRNSEGTIVHAHEFIEFDDVTPLSEQQLFETALAAAKRTLHGAHGDLTPAISSREELEQLRLDAQARFQPGKES
jgi:hypothetical protein